MADQKFRTVPYTKCGSERTKRGFEYMGYESPIDITIGDMVSNIVKSEEESLVCEVRQAIGYNIDKQELFKALQYDRDQYEKGKADALAELWHYPRDDGWDRDTLPSSSGLYLCEVKIYDINIGFSVKHFSRKEMLFYVEDNIKILRWMEIPK